MKLACDTLISVCKLLSKLLQLQLTSGNPLFENVTNATFLYMQMEIWLYEAGLNPTLSRTFILNVLLCLVQGLEGSLKSEKGTSCEASETENTCVTLRSCRKETTKKIRETVNKVELIRARGKTCPEYKQMKWICLSQLPTCSRAASVHSLII